MQKIARSQALPLVLLGVLLLIMLVTVFTSANGYGRTIDEGVQDAFGHKALSWYKTRGKDTSYFVDGVNYNMPQHGIIFDVIVAEAQNKFGNYWHTRAIITGLAGVIGVIAIALCGYELGGWWIALLAALGLWLYPRYYGAIFNNPKDIPFAAASTLIIWSVFILIKHWKLKSRFIVDSMLVGFCIGLANSIRVSSVTWYLILLMLLVGWWIFYGKNTVKARAVSVQLLKQGAATIIIALTSLLTMMALWPYIFLNPLVNLADSIQVMSKYPWGGSVLLNGITYLAVAEPRSYALIWLVVGSPPITLSLFLLGVFIPCIIFFKHKEFDPKLVPVFLSLLVPLGIIIGLHSELYDGLRHILFLIPPIILLAAYGLRHALILLWSHKQKVIASALIVLTLASYGLVIKDMIDLHPYEYVYITPLIGGVSSAGNKYTLDYWRICSKPAAEWLAKNYKAYTNRPNPTVDDGYNQDWFAFQFMNYLPGSFSTNPQAAEFFVTSEVNAQKNYKTIHTESIEGIPVCTVKVRTIPPASSINK